jgi:hypothetical protein
MLEDLPLIFSNDYAIKSKGAVLKINICKLDRFWIANNFLFAMKRSSIAIKLTLNLSARSDEQA